MDFGDVVILILGVASFAISIIVKSKARKASEDVAAPATEVISDRQPDVFTASEDVHRIVVNQEEGVSSFQRSKDIQEFVQEQEEVPEKEKPAFDKIDKRKLIIYSELLKPKF